MKLALQAGAHEFLTGVPGQLLGTGLCVTCLHFLLLRGQCRRWLAAQAFTHKTLTRIAGKLLIAGLDVASFHEFLLRALGISRMMSANAQHQHRCANSCEDALHANPRSQMIAKRR